MDWAGFGFACFCLFVLVIVMAVGITVYEWIYDRGRQSTEKQIDSLKTALDCKERDISNLKWTIQQFNAYKTRVEEAVNGESAE